MRKSNVFALGKQPVHLGLGARATIQETFTGSLDWYERYAERNGADGVEGRLVSMHAFTSPWTMWEMHPLGDELVVCVAGEITLSQEYALGVQQVVLRAGDAIINPAGVWHTADVSGPASALFVTAGAGTEHRPR